MGDYAVRIHNIRFNMIQIGFISDISIYKTNLINI